MKPIIHVENLSKQYTIGAKAEPYSTLRESLVRAARKPIDRIRRGGGKSADSQFWALKDVSFDVMPGEVVGIIGRNGAGKSTLLKILSRITEPTSGKVELYGRVGSLLEVGTGFHPELTGRENIFLNGAILGMRREEIAKKFDEIVDFAEIEGFLDTPVKRYSSGMYVRLAFAVAAHMEPEILIVDEVLAVGDVQFQKKCLGKMKDVSEHGRTVLFVSHNLPAVRQLCSSGLLLDSGRMIIRDDVGSVLERYQYRENSDVAQRDPIENQKLTLTSWVLVRSDGERSYSCNTKETVTFEMEVVTNKLCTEVELGFVIRNDQDEILLSGNSRDFGKGYFNLAEGKHLLSVDVRLPLRSGKYVVDLAIAVEGEIVDHWVSTKLLTILDDYAGVLEPKWRGQVNESFEFSHETIP